MKHFVGLDVSMKETAVCVVDDAGQRIWEGSVPSSADRIAAIIREKAPELVRAGMETGPQAVWLWHALREQGIAVDCIHARRAAAALKLQANKTDRNDAFGLARLVHSGWYEPVAIKSFDRYRMRAVLTAQERIVRMCTTMINQIRGLAKTFGLTVSAGKGQVFEASVRRILPDDIVLRDLFESLLSVLSGLKDQRRAFDRQLARFAREDEACRIVSSAPGVGNLTAIAFVTAADDPARFRTACDVGAYLGLTPKRYRSGEVDIGGRISKTGDRLTRKLLFDAATVILYRASRTIALKQSGLRLSARSGSWKARVALARKLEGPRGPGTQAGCHPAHDVEDQHNVREQERQRINTAKGYQANSGSGECPVFCVWLIWSMFPESSKDDDDFQRTAGRTFEGLCAA